MIEKIMEQHDLTHDILVDHYYANKEAEEGREKRLRAFSREKRERISQFYAKLRSLGIYPIRPNNGKMVFYKIKVNYEQDKANK